MKYKLFLGCTIPARQINYEISTRKISDVLGIELIDDDFGCCGFPVEPINDTIALSMAAMNLKKAAESNEPLLTLCSACGEMLSKAEKQLEKEEIAKEVNKLLQKNIGDIYNGEKPKVLHFARMLYEDYGIEKLKNKISKPLKEVKIATHPGCHYVRPNELFQEFDDPEEPKSLDILVEVTGAKVVEYIGKTDCCGGSILAVNEDVAKAMTVKKLDNLKGKVDAMVLICPFCSIMFDKYQKSLEEEFEKKYDIPILYYTQLLGLALGIDPEELGFEVNSVSVNDFLEKVM